MSSNVETLVKNLIDSNKVVVFSKTYCGFCARTKAALKDEVKAQNLEEDDITIIELDNRKDGGEIQSYLASPTVTGQSTVPNIFVNQKHVGGNDKFQAARSSGKFKQLLAA